MTKIKRYDYKAIGIGRNNAGIYYAYRRALLARIGDMSKDYRDSLEGDFPFRGEPDIDIIQQTLEEKRKKWRDRFEYGALALALWFIGQNVKDVDYYFFRRLSKVGYLPTFPKTKETDDLIKVCVAENVSLIKSIPEQYHRRVQSYISARFMGKITKTDVVNGLVKIGKITRRRANMIADDQNNKVNQSYERARALSLGFRYAIWVHTAQPHPRPDHKKAGQERKIFDLKKGCKISGNYIQPGQLINCKCRANILLLKNGVINNTNFKVNK